MLSVFDVLLGEVPVAAKAAKATRKAKAAKAVQPVLPIDGVVSVGRVAELQRDCPDLAEWLSRHQMDGHVLESVRLFKSVFWGGWDAAKTAKLAWVWRD